MSSVATSFSDVKSQIGASTYCLLFSSLLFCYAYFHQRIDEPIAASRIDTLHAMVQQKRLYIDDYLTTSDYAVYQGHYYSDKAPGVAVVALPAFAAATVVLESAGLSLESGEGWLYSSWMAAIGSVGVAASVGGLFYVAWLGHWIRGWPALMTTLTLFLGVTVLPYATCLFSHAMVTGLIAIALWGSVFPSGCREGGRTTLRDVVSGGCCGLALASEYTAAIPIGGILVYLICGRVRRGLVFLGGMILPMLMVPIFGWICFDNPLAIGYDYTRYKQMHRGFYGLQAPSLQVMVQYLFSPAKGLLFWCPYVVLAIGGLPALRKVDRGIFRLVAVVCLLQFLAMSGKRWDWQAGYTLGPRYLSPMMPFLMLGAGFGALRFPRLATVLAVASVGLSLVATMVCGTPDYAAWNPLMQIHIPGLLAGKFVHNVGEALGLESPWTIGPFALGLLLFGMALRKEMAPDSWMPPWKAQGPKP